jgi:hypothetical protein
MGKRTGYKNHKGFKMTKITYMKTLSIILILPIIMGGCSSNLDDKKHENKTIRKMGIEDNIIGTWVLDSVEYNIVAYLPSFCHLLKAGSKFYFHGQNKLEIFPCDSANKCNIYSYSVRDNEINLTEYDMGLQLDIIKLENNKMVLKSNYVTNDIPKGLNAEQIKQYYKAGKTGYKMYFSRMK